MQSSLQTLRSVSQQFPEKEIMRFLRMLSFVVLPVIVVTGRGQLWDEVATYIFHVSAHVQHRIESWVLNQLRLTIMA